MYLSRKGLAPHSRLARFSLYLLGVDVFLIVYRSAMVKLRGPDADPVGGWIWFLSYLCAFLFTIVALRWIRRHVMWALRNRLIVTYIFIGVIPVVLLICMGLLITYLFVGQFASYVASSDLQMEVRRLDAVNQRLAAEIATALRDGKPITADILKNASAAEEPFPNRLVTAWYRGKSYMLASREERPNTSVPPVPVIEPKTSDENVATLALDGAGATLRAARRLTVGKDPLVVVSSVPLDRQLMGKVAERIGIVSMEPFRRSVKDNAKGTGGGKKLTITSSNEELDLDQQTDSAGRPRSVESPMPLPPPTNRFDREVTFLATVPAIDWDSGADATVLMVVHTRPSLMYERLFRTVGQFVNAVLYVLAAVAIFFGLIELIALIIGVRLTRTITESIHKLYRATQHVNDGNFSHRIRVTSKDQLAALETSFNSMTENIERLLREQKEKQRLENELSIAQEVQAQLFPTGVFDTESLELYGYCEPARTVSGDYYDFVPLGADQLALAVGDISGKGISAALLMASIHSAVRAYSLERVPMIAAAGVGQGGAFAPSEGEKASRDDISPSLLCTMLNRQLYASTASARYATMFLGVYDGYSRKLSYCNAGHLPPIILSSDGSIHRLEVGGSVVGLLPGLAYNESEATLRSGDIFIAYSDGITEPENDFGEFGEERLLQLIRENQELPLQRIADLAVAAVKDWIGGNEQPDDITIVLARQR